MTKPTSARGQLTKFMELEEQRLNLRMQAIRAAIDHAGEKGRGLESAVMDFIRGLLPDEYGLDTGFIAYRQGDNDDVKLSPQLDIIIYDRVRGVALADLGTARVFPLEAVYGYVEVKTELNATELAKAVAANLDIRRAVNRRYYHTVWCSPIESRVIDYSELQSLYADIPAEVRGKRRILKPFMLPPRAFIVCLESEPIEPNKLAARLDKAHSSDARFHGVLVAGKAFLTQESFSGEPVDEPANRRFTAWKQLGAVRFRTMLQMALASFPRVPGGVSFATDDYFGRIQEASGEVTIRTNTTGSAIVTSAGDDP